MAAAPSQRPTVIVTGSGGFLGSAIARRLAAGYRVFGFDLFLPKRPQEGSSRWRSISPRTKACQRR